MYILDKQYPALVIDPDKSFLNALSSEPYAVLSPPIIASTGAEAQALLSDRSQTYAGIFINPKIGGPGSLSVIRCAHLFHAGTPLFLLCDEDSPFPYSQRELQKLAVQKTVQKPMNYNQLMALVAPLVKSFNAYEALEKASQNLDPLHLEFTARDEDFTPIRASHFLSGNQCFFDVYIRMKTGRFIKVLKAGDSFTADRLTSYLQKGLTHFYLKKEVQETYVKYCDHLATALARQTGAPTEAKIMVNSTFGEEVLKSLEDHNVGHVQLQYASQFTANTLKIIEDLQLAQNHLVQEYMHNLALYEHAIATTMVTAMLLTPMGIESDSLKKRIGLAAFLHDIGLLKTTPHLEELEKSQMNGEELAIYHAHPKIGARILSDLRGIDNIVVQAVELHHVRRDNSGFPQMNQVPTTSRLGELIGISDEFVRLIQKSKEKTWLQPLKEMQNKIFDGFSFPVIQGFSSIFFQNKKGADLELK